MDIFAVVMPVWVGAYQRFDVRENALYRIALPTLAPGLRSSRCRVRHGVKADDIMVALYVLPLLVLAVFEIRVRRTRSDSGQSGSSCRRFSRTRL